MLVSEAQCICSKYSTLQTQWSTAGGYYLVQLCLAQGTFVVFEQHHHLHDAPSTYVVVIALAKGDHLNLEVTHEVTYLWKL